MTGLEVVVFVGLLGWLLFVLQVSRARAVRARRMVKRGGGRKYAKRR